MMKPQQSTAPMTAEASLSHLTTMASLALPKDLYWDGKSEPVSPSNNELFATDFTDLQNWICGDNFANEILSLSAGDLEQKPNVELLHELIDGNEAVIELCELKEENWPPQVTGITTQIPLYSEFDSTISNQTNLVTKFVSTPNEVNFDEYNLGVSTLTTLTPPQSPPRNGAFAAIYEQHDNNPPVQQHTLHYRPTAVPVVPTPLASAATTQANAYLIPNVITTEFQSHQHVVHSETTSSDIKDVLEQSQIVDQIIEECAKDLPDMSDEFEPQYTYSPPSEIEEFFTDEDWMPTNSAGSSPASYSSSSSSYCGDDRYTADIEKSATPEPVVKKRRPYGRGVEDRKIRKKEQNKNAATRYRQKKKLEMELVLNEEQILTKKNEELKGKYAECLSEMKYLKKLIREFYRKSALKKSSSY